MTLRQTMRFVLWGIAFLACFIAAVGFWYQQTETSADSKLHPEPGRRVDVGGRKLWINCSGTGTPVVILESGLGAVSVEWETVQSGVSKFTRVCSYDRAGYGNSDEEPSQRTSANIARELQNLLQSSGEKPPYLMVGHSFGGYNVRVFAGEHPDSVKGMVLVDAIQEDQYALLPPVWKQVERDLEAKWNAQARWAALQIGLGYTRWRLGALAHEPFFYLYLQPKYLRSRANELDNIHVSAEQARAAGGLGDMPLVVLSAGKPLQPGNGLTADDVERYEKIWIYGLQSRLTGLSSNGHQIIVQSGHNIPGEDPAAVVDAIKKVWDKAQHAPSH